MRDILHIRCATTDDLPIILRMINEASDWLRNKETEQWAQPWPTEAARDARVRRGLRGDTWMVEQQGSPIATVTSRRHGNQTLWTHREQLEPAVYVSRLIVTRSAAGLGIGAAMIDWAAGRGAQDRSAQWVRIDVWTTNVALHNYYENRGFMFCRVCPFDKDTYPSAALFQKPLSEVDVDAAARFTEVRRSTGETCEPLGPVVPITSTSNSRLLPQRAILVDDRTEDQPGQGDPPLLARGGIEDERYDSKRSSRPPVQYLYEHYDPR